MDVRLPGRSMALKYWSAWIQLRSQFGQVKPPDRVVNADLKV
jgi:hypothetical protein